MLLLEAEIFRNNCLILIKQTLMEYALVKCPGNRDTSGDRAIKITLFINASDCILYKYYFKAASR